MRIIEAIYEDGVFRPRDAVDLEDGSCVELELKKVHAPGIAEAQRRWERHPVSELEAEVLMALDSDRRPDLEELSNRLARIMNLRKAPAERIKLDRAEVERAVRNLIESGYVTAVSDPASPEHYRLTAMGLVVATLERRVREDRRRKARGRAPRREPRLPIPEFFVRSFHDLDIAYLDLGRRAYRILKANGIDNVGALCRITSRDLYQFERIGKKSIEEVEGALWRIGLGLKSRLREL